MIFIVAALLYYQSHSHEGFVDANRAAWTPEKTPVAGRLYDPATNDSYPVPADLNRALPAAPMGSVPTSQQRPVMTPGTGTMTAPREAMAQLKDLHELDNKILLWLDAAGQKEREQPGSLTPSQLQERVMLQARLNDVRTQLGTGMITDTWKRVADETMQLRRENAGWQQRSPSLDEVYSFGQGSDPNAFLTEEDYIKFYGLFNASVQELQGLAQPDPLQKVRLQQLQVMRQDLMDTAKKMVPPIKMGAAQLYLRQLLKPDQPLPTLFTVSGPPVAISMEDSPFDVIADLRDIQWKLTVSYDPVAQELKRATAAMLDRLKTGEMSPQDARRQIAAFKVQGAPVAIAPTSDSVGSAYNPKNLIKRATTLCKQIEEAFPEDGEALGCRKVHSVDEAETVINTVCDRLRYSVPSVTPEQFNCPARNV